MHSLFDTFAHSFSLSLSLFTLYHTICSPQVLAGRACTRAVAMPSLLLEDVSDDVEDFTSQEQVIWFIDWWSDCLCLEYDDHVIDNR